jgi:hypothetical protein
MRVCLTILLLSLMSTTVRADGDSRDELVAAVNKKDVATVGNRVVVPFKVNDLHFADPACSRFAGKMITVEQKDLEAFVGCMAGLGIQRIDRDTAVYIK